MMTAISCKFRHPVRLQTEQKQKNNGKIKEKRKKKKEKKKTTPYPTSMVQYVSRQNTKAEKKGEKKKKSTCTWTVNPCPRSVRLYVSK